MKLLCPGKMSITQQRGEERDAFGNQFHRGSGPPEKLKAHQCSRVERKEGGVGWEALRMIKVYTKP